MYLKSGHAVRSIWFRFRIVRKLLHPTVYHDASNRKNSSFVFYSILFGLFVQPIFNGRSKNALFIYVVTKAEVT